MRELKICRCKENEFTIVVAVPDYNVFPNEGIFPNKHYYYRVPTEYELLQLITEEKELFISDIETIYYGNLDVTAKYLEGM